MQFLSCMQLLSIVQLSLMCAIMRLENVVKLDSNCMKLQQGTEPVLTMPTFSFQGKCTFQDEQQ